MKLRKKNNTTIQYILVSDESPIISTIIPPKAFENEVFDFIKNCPSDIFQLIDSLDYLELYLRNVWNYGYDFQVINVENFKIVEPLINSTVQIQLFFLDGLSEKHSKLFEQLKSTESVIRFFHFYNSEHKMINEKRIVISSSHFIKTLIENGIEILKFLNLGSLYINPSVAIEYKELFEFHYFTPTRTNFFVINNIIGNFGYDEDTLTSEQQKAKQIEESTKALKNQNSFERQSLFLNQIKIIDYFFNAAYREKVLLPAGYTSSILPPIMLVVPFHNPDLKDIYGDKDLTDLLQVEQTENYLNVTVAKQV